MNLYQQQHQFYCGIDLHANVMCACVANMMETNTASKLSPVIPILFMRNSNRLARTSSVAEAECW